MTRFLKKSKNEIGLSPQELIFRGVKKIDKVAITRMSFDETNLEEEKVYSIEGLADRCKDHKVNWINVHGLHDLELLKEIGKEFKLDNLLLADVLETNSRAKLHEYDDHIYISMKMMEFNVYDDEKITVENLSIVFNEHVLISFQERKGDFFEPVRNRIRGQKRTLRSSQPDYLANALMDTVIDHYLYILSLFGEKIESFDEILLEEPDQEFLDDFNVYKKELNYIRKIIKPAKEMLLVLSKIESDFILEKNDIHFKQLVSNIDQASDTSDGLRDLLSDQLNIYHMTISSKLNDIIKFLTIFSVIFIPLTFIAGVYGTNFDVIPELHYEYGYFIMLLIMVIVALLMLFYFKRKKWL